MTSSPPTSILLAHSYFLHLDAKQSRKMRPYPPLATLVAASVLHHEGYAVSFFDSMLSKSTDGFRELLESEHPSVVAILEDNFNFLTKMCTTRMRDAAFEMIRMAKSSGAKVIVNGSDATDRSVLYLEAGADAIIAGETEHTLPELLRAWRKDQPPDEVAGLVLAPLSTQLTEDCLIRTSRRPPATDLDALPLPAWHLVDTNRYRSAWMTHHQRFSWNVATTRGCPYQCNWCAKPVYGTRYAQRSAANVAGELLRLKRSVTPDHIWFADDIFGLNPGWIETFATELESRGVRIPFTMQSRVDLMTESACAALARAGAEEVWLGVESGSQSILDSMNKVTTIQQVREATRRLRSNGIRPSWFIQLGYPGEDWPSIQMTRDLIRSERPSDIGVSVSYPLPGTKFHDRVKSQFGRKTNWTESDDLTMLFQGTYTTEFYRMIRDTLHDEALVAAGRALPSDGHLGARLADRWRSLAEMEPKFRNEHPTRLSESAAEQ